VTARNGHRRPRVVVLGAGFGGLRAVQRLRRADVDVTLVDRHNYHTFMPLLYEVASAGLSANDIAQPIRAILRGGPNVEFVVGAAREVDCADRTATTTAGAIAFDYLVIAIGTVTNSFGIEGVDHYATGLKSIQDADTVRNGVLRNFERAAVEPDAAERARLMTMVVVGGGPTGVELAGALAELKHHVLKRDFPQLDVSAARVILIEATDRLLSAFPRRLQERARAQLVDLGVEVRLSSPVERLEEGEVHLPGETIAASNIAWVAGTAGAPLAIDPAPPRSRDGRIAVSGDLSVPGAPRVFAIGDIAYLPDAHGRPHPMLAQVALQQGELVAENIARDIEGRPRRTFKYRDRGVMATVGRRRAVAHVFGMQVSGLLAWVLWLVVHLLAIVSLRNRAAVLLNWTWNYVRYDRANRLLTDDAVGGTREPQ